MTSASNHELARRMALAEQVARCYAANPNVAAVIIAGSVARGTADRFSDIEIDIFWHTQASDDERQALIAQIGGTLLGQGADENEWADTFTIGGIKIDTSQFLVATVERWLTEVVDHADTEVEKQLLLAAIQHGKPIAGTDLIARWRAKAASYPDALVLAMVAEYLAFRPRSLMEMLAARDDRLFLHRCLVGVEQQILSVLVGLNRLYIAHPYFKWLDWQVAQMQIAPPDLARRLKQALQAEPVAAADQLHQLIEEIFGLVKQHLPAFDTSAARAIFDERRVMAE